MEFERVEWDKGTKKSTVIDTVFLPADDVILAIGQENARRAIALMSLPPSQQEERQQSMEVLPTPMMSTR